MASAAVIVALRKESVDRNMNKGGENEKIDLVALRKESVDRNLAGLLLGSKGRGRSPQGERG